jgi:hypothetical protein
MAPRASRVIIRIARLRSQSVSKPTYIRPSAALLSSAKGDDASQEAKPLLGVGQLPLIHHG